MRSTRNNRLFLKIETNYRQEDCSLHDDKKKNSPRTMHARNKASFETETVMFLRSRAPHLHNFIKPDGINDVQRVRLDISSIRTGISPRARPRTCPARQCVPRERCLEGGGGVARDDRWPARSAFTFVAVVRGES